LCLQAYGFGVTHIDVAPQPPWTSVPIRILVVGPLHVEDGGVERQPVIQPLTFDTDLIVIDQIRSIRLRDLSCAGGTRAVDPAHPESLAEEPVYHEIVGEVVADADFVNRVADFADISVRAVTPRHKVVKRN